MSMLKAGGVIVVVEIYFAIIVVEVFYGNTKMQTITVRTKRVLQLLLAPAE